MKVTLRVDEYDISDVKVGDACTVTVTATEDTFDSRIDSIDYISASGGNVAYYSAVAYVDVRDGVYPGMQVTVSLPREQAENVVVLKLDALSFDAQNSAFVYMYDDEGALEEIPVEVGVSNGNYVEIQSGVSDGDVVYVESTRESASSGIGSLLSGIFGSQQMNAPSAGAGGYPIEGGFGGAKGERPEGFERSGGMPQMGGGGQ